MSRYPSELSTAVITSAQTMKTPKITIPSGRKDGMTARDNASVAILQHRGVRVSVSLHT